MKRKPKLKNMLISTGACVILTLYQLFSDRFLPSYRVYRNGLELLILWLVVIIAWIVYLIGVYRSRKQDKNEEPWQ